MTFAVPPLVQCSGNDDQVSHQDAPADPAFKAIRAVIRTSAQLHGAFDDTDSPFNAIAEPLPFFEPDLFLVRFSLRRAMSALG
jgi:hypothetical protein